MADLDVAIRIAAQDSASGPLGAIERALHGLGGAVTAPLGGIGHLVNGLGAIGLAANGLGALGSAAADLGTGLVAGNAQMETYETQLTTLMGSAGAAKDRLAELAKFGAETPFELPEVVRAEKVLLGFGLTGQKAVDLTGRSATDLRTIIGDVAAGTGASFEEIALNFGKFSAGATGEAISRFQELGIVTREQMAGMGIEFSKAGELISPLPQAMAAAVTIAQQKFGGGMQALSKTFDGQMSTLTDNFNQAKNAITLPIFDVLKESLAGLNDVLSSGGFQDGLKEVAQLMAVGVKQGVDLARSAFEAASPVLQSFGGIVQQVLSGNFKGATDSLLAIAKDLVPKIAAQVGEWAQAFIAWIVPMIPPFLEALADFERQWLGWLAEQVPPLIEHLAAWAAAFIDWVAPQVDPLLHELGHLLERLFGWIGDQLPGFAAKLGEWGLSFVEWVAPRIPPLLLELGKLLVEIGGWMLTTALPAIVDKLVQWGRAFIQWIADNVLPNLPGALASIASALSSWIGDTARSIGTWALDLGAQLVRGFVGGLANLASELLSAVRSAILAIEVNAGPFHLSASGFRIDAPQMPTIQLPALPQPPPGWQAVPAFAAGGVVPGPIGAPMRAVVHGGEMVLPLGSSLRAPAIDYDRLAAAFGQQPIVLQLDGRVLARVTRERLLQVGQRNGNAFGTLGVAGIT